MKRTFLFLLTALSCGFSTCTFAPSADKAAKLQGNSATHVPTAPLIDPETVALRERLEQEYLQVVAGVYSDYHGIQVEWRGKGCFVSHPLFAGYELAAGPLTPAIQQWISINKNDLQKADVECVGIESGTGHTSWIDTGIKPIS